METGKGERPHNEGNDSNAIHAFSSALEAKDAYTYGHSKRVNVYAVALAEKIGLSPDEVANVSMAASLHDIGKIGIPDKILSKKDKLNEKDWNTIKTHPKLGANIISSIPKLAPCVNIVLHHHERWDGSGYPKGLKGEEIPIEARIIAIAESFDAMTSAQFWRPAFSLDEAITELRQGAGSQFDPELVDAFIRIVEARPPGEGQQRPVPGSMPGGQQVRVIPENVLKEWEQHGISLVEVWPHEVQLRHHGKVVARFGPFTTLKELQKEARDIIEGDSNPERSLSNEQRRIDRSGTELGEEGKFCSSCWARASEVDPEGTTQVKYPHQVATVVGYVFGFLGGWLGLVFGVYLVTREHWRAKDQGKIILSVSVVMTILWMFILLG